MVLWTDDSKLPASDACNRCLCCTNNVRLHCPVQVPDIPSTKVSVRGLLFVSQHNTFLGKEFLASRPNPRLVDHPLSAVRGCLFNIFAAIRSGGISSIRNLRMHHALVTETHLSLFDSNTCFSFNQKTTLSSTCARGSMI